MNKKLIITGGGGLIGTAARQAFESAGWSVSILDLRSHDLDGLPVEHQCNVADVLDLGSKLQDSVGIVHLASISRVCDAEREPEKCIHVNLVGTMRLLKAAAASGCRWFIFGSSREVYGEAPRLPVRETDNLDAINIYGRVKVKGEQLVAEQCKANNMLYSILRFSNVYGHLGDHPTRVINAFILRAIAGEPLYIHGGNQMFDFTYYKDTAKAIVAAAECLHNGKASLPPIHILPGQGTSIKELARAVLEVTNSHSPIHYKPGRDYDVDRFYGDPELMKRMLDTQCNINLKEGIKLTLHDYLRLWS